MFVLLKTNSAQFSAYLFVGPYNNSGLKLTLINSGLNSLVQDGKSSEPKICLSGRKKPSNLSIPLFMGFLSNKLFVKLVLQLYVYQKVHLNVVSHSTQLFLHIFTQMGLYITTRHLSVVLREVIQ